MPALADHLEHFRGRVLQDALTEATAAYWERRAQVFEAAAPRPGDYHGRASRAELQAAHDRCHATAKACRARAQVIRGEHPEPISADVCAALAEVA